MISYQEDSAYFKWLTQKMDVLRSSKALVLDIRDNSGGTRDILQLLAPYFIPLNTDSWIGNIVRLRVDTTLEEDLPEMSIRKLFAYTSPHFSIPQTV